MTETLTPEEVLNYVMELHIGNDVYPYFREVSFRRRYNLPIKNLVGMGTHKNG